MPLERVQNALNEIRRGHAVVLVDDEHRENESDFVVAAEKVTPDWVNLMLKHGRGLVCLSLTPERAEELRLRPMVDQPSAADETPFTVSIEARSGVTTGISAADRATTILTAVDPRLDGDSIRSPGHVFPIVARPGGVLTRAGHVEGSVDLARLAGLRPAAVTCKILSTDGQVARKDEVEALAASLDLRIVSVADLIAFRRVKEKLVRRTAEVSLPLIYGDFRVLVYRSEHDGLEHVAFVKGEPSAIDPVLVRMQSVNVALETLRFLQRGALSPLATALSAVEREGSGIVVCLGSAAGERISDVVARLAGGDATAGF
jgi:3,4-dihydroxy 2-butanone 4-phosphate synthase/GTP cyclohydrolase II